MLDRAKHLYRTSVMAVDGPVGRVEDVLYDEVSWAIRYVVVDTGHWLPGRKVLISPMAFEPMAEAGPIVLRRTRQLIHDSPSVDLEDGVPSSWEQEAALGAYYGLPAHCGVESLRGSGGAAGAPEGPAAGAPPAMHRAAGDEPPPPEGRLRRATAFKGYAIHAADGRLGRVTDILFDNEAWDIRYFVIGTRRGWSRSDGVLIAVHWIDRVDWARRRVDVPITMAQVKGSPVYDGRAPVHRDYEVRLHSAYDRTGYRD